MKNIILKGYISLILLLSCITAHAQDREDHKTDKYRNYRYSAFTDVLNSVELNNERLKAQRSLMEAKRLEARSVNNLDDPELEFSHMWSKNSNKNGEITLKQSFDFPSAYGARRNYANLRTQQAQEEYDLALKEVLTETQTLCVEIVSLRMQNDYFKMMANDTEKVLGMTSDRLAAGDANILEENNAKFQNIAAKNALQQNLIDLRTAEKRLRNLNGGISIDFSSRSYYEKAELPPFEEIERLWINYAPEIGIVRSELQIAQNDIKVMRRQSLPKVSLGYKHAFESGGEHANGVVAGLSIPIFSGRNTVKRAKAQAEAAASELSGTIIDTRTTVRQLYDKAQMIDSILDDYKAVIDNANSAGLLIKAIEAGQISVVEYYSQLQPLYDTYNTYIELYKEYMTICAQLLMVC